MKNSTEDKWKTVLKILSNMRKYASEEGGTESALIIAYLDTYIKKCKSPTEIKITQSVLAALHTVKDEKEGADPKNAVRTFMKNTFRPFLKRYCETIGKDLAYEIDIAAGKYDEIILTKRAVAEKNFVYYKIDTDRKTLNFKSKPQLILMSAWSLSAFLVGITYYYWGKLFVPAQRDIVSTLFLLILVAAIALIVLTLPLIAIMGKNNFRHVCFNRFFLSSRDEGILFASYCATCPSCNGKVELTGHRVKKGTMRSYIGECQRHPELHLYTLDYSNMSGKKLEHD